MLWVLHAVAVMVGVILALQVGVNAQLQRAIASPFMVSFVSFVVGSLGLGCVVMVVRAPIPGATLAQVPWWCWLGGLLGALHVTLSLALAPKIGAAALFAAIVCGQMISALTFDHLGAFGLAQHPVTLVRLLGVALVLAGMLLIQRT